MHDYWLKLDKGNAYKNNLRMIAEDLGSRTGLKRYYLSTVEDLEKQIVSNQRQNRNNCYYEVMPNSLCTYRNECNTCFELLKHMGTRFYLDIEFPDPCDWLNFETSAIEPLEIGQNIKTFFLKSLKAKYKEYDIKILEISSHRAGKYSWHFVAVIYDTKNKFEKLFYDCIAIRELMTYFFNKYHKTIDLYDYYEVSDTTGEQVMKNAIDQSVYANHKCFRTPWSHKFGKKTGPLLPKEKNIDFKDLLVIQPYTNIEKQQFDLRGYISTTKVNRKYEPLVKKRKLQRSDTFPKPIQDIHINRYSKHLYCLFSNWKLWEEFKTNILKQFPSVDFNKTQFKSIHKIYIPLPDVKKCPMARGSNNGEHKNNSTYLFVYPSQGKLKWCCQDPVCKSRGGYKYIDIDMSFKMKIVNEYNKMYTIKLD